MNRSDDLISRQAAIDIADDLRACISVEGYWAWTERLKKLPSAAEVVRCKDCIHAKEITQYGCSECVRHCEKLKIVTSPDWFCAEGKRDEQDLP